MVELQTSQLDSVFHALGDATRRRMLRALSEGEQTIGALAAPFAISLAAASKHIKVLEGAGLIRREVRGRTHLCRLEPGPLASANAWLAFYERFWSGRLDALEQVLRQEDTRASQQPPKRRLAMTVRSVPDAFGILTEPATLTIQRLLPGPIERVWAYLTESELRRQWLASGEMAMQVGAAVELVWRNDELSDPPSRRPEGFPAEHRMQAEVTELDPPHRLAFTWGSTGGVTFELQAGGRGGAAYLDPPPGRRAQHLAQCERGLAHPSGRAGGTCHGPAPAPFWDSWRPARAEYEHRLPG